MFALARCVTAVALAALLTGCSGSPSLVETQGTVIGPDGKPLPNVLVTFTPVETGGRKVINSTAVTDADGKFVLSADTGQPGAVPGAHKVTLIDNALAEEDEPKASGRPRPRNRIPLRYSSPAETPLQVTVEPGKSHELKVQ